MQSTEGVEFKAHRCVLAESCDYFEALFSSKMRDDADAAVATVDIPGPIFSSVLDFFYNGTCDVEASALPSLLEAGARLQAALLQESVAWNIERKGRQAGNALPVWAIGDRLSISTLVGAAKKATADGFETLSTSCSWRRTMPCYCICCSRTCSVFTARM